MTTQHTARYPLGSSDHEKFVHDGPMSECQACRDSVILPEYSSEFDSPVDDLLRQHLYPAIELFRRKAKDYSEADGFFTADHLGAAGQYGDLFRKMPKLKKSMWDKQPLNGEQPVEILQDFLGHVLLAIGYLSGWRKK